VLIRLIVPHISDLLHFINGDSRQSWDLAMAAKPGSSVFVGNIAFSITEEELVSIFAPVGRVLKFRLITDKDTGRSKGFGFLDFADPDAAESAIRNLDGHEVGGRKLRVAWPSGSDAKDNQSGPPQQDNAVPQAAPVAPLPTGVDLPPNLKCSDAISQTLNQLPAPQLLDVLTQMKAMAISEPQRATEILKSAPQLSYALFQALILMNLVDPKILAQVVEQASTQQAAPVPQQPPPQQYPGYPPPPQGMPGMPPRPPPQAYPPQPPPQQAPPPLSQEQLLQQVMAMDQRTIDSLPPTERSQIMALRAQMGIR